MAGHSILPSQFVFTYGVGSIIEAPSGPRMIPEFSQWGSVFGFGSNPSVSDFEIDFDVPKSLLEGSVFEIPTNVKMKANDSMPIFRTFPFPNWALCVQHNNLFELNDDNTRCTICIKEGINPGRKQAIRFIQACPNGHVDDIDWSKMIHHRGGCANRIFQWQTFGGSVKDVSITCKCGGSVTLKEVYKKIKHCAGKFPESGKSSDACSATSQVILRGSSMLRIPHLLAIIAIPGPTSPLHNILQMRRVREIISIKDQWDITGLKQALVTKSKNDPDPHDMEIIDVISSITDQNKLDNAIKDTLTNLREAPQNMEQQRFKEFRTLQNASVNGHPLNQEIDPYFYVRKKDVRHDISLGSKKIRVTPVKSLRVITVQKGYQRLGTGSKNAIVERFYKQGETKWYPGLQQIGEGIFIDDAEIGFEINSDSWNQQFQKMNNQIQYHAVFAWWHSLSHRIISAISTDSGYSSASIREIIYAKQNPDTSKVIGGILLYTSQPGGDGSLGGLVAKVPEFENILDIALRDLDFCSNDPLCSQQSVHNIGHSGASCYACMQLSETSCAYYNRHLDRKLLLENL